MSLCFLPFPDESTISLWIYDSVDLRTFVILKRPKTTTLSRESLVDFGVPRI